MSAPAETFAALRRFRRQLPDGALLLEAGVVPSFLYLVVSGRVVLEAADETGRRSVVGEVGPGGVVGVSACAGRPAATSARTATASVVMAVPMSALSEAFGVAPEFAIAVVRGLGEQLGAAGSPAGIREREEEGGAPPAAREGAADSLGSYPEQSFFRDTVQCPACDRAFVHLRVRESAVRPEGRDTDFRITYKTVDPSLYAVTVCPHCAYASYTEDFSDLPAEERRMIVAGQAARLALVPHSLCGERDRDDAMLSLHLATLCADARGAGLRRRAGLLHRMAWIERARGNAQAERLLLGQARDAYHAMFEQDPDVQDDAAVRVAYLLGDLSARLGDLGVARQWLTECIAAGSQGGQAGLVRLARARLEETNLAIATHRVA